MNYSILFKWTMHQTTETMAVVFFRLQSLSEKKMKSCSKWQEWQETRRKDVSHSAQPHQGPLNSGGAWGEPRGLEATTCLRWGGTWIDLSWSETLIAGILPESRFMMDLLEETWEEGRIWIGMIHNKFVVKFPVRDTLGLEINPQSQAFLTSQRSKLI